MDHAARAQQRKAAVAEYSFGASGRTGRAGGTRGSQSDAYPGKFAGARADSAGERSRNAGGIERSGSRGEGVRGDAGQDRGIATGDRLDSLGSGTGRAHSVVS